MGHFGDGSFQSISCSDCSGNDNQTHLIRVKRKHTYSLNMKQPNCTYGKTLLVVVPRYGNRDETL